MVRWMDRQNIWMGEWIEKQMDGWKEGQKRNI